jgi:hypothetical protein
MSGRNPTLNPEWAERKRARREEEEACTAGQGGLILTIAPKEEASAVLGTNLMDFSRLAEAADAGMAQSHREAETAERFWTARS